MRRYLIPVFYIRKTIDPMNDLIQSGINKYPDGPCEVREATMMESLVAQKNRHEQKLKEVNEAISALEKHPEVSTVIDLVRKATRY